MIAFDQYQRYQTISVIVKKISEKFSLKSLKILEVGANAQKNLEKFIDADIYYTDIEMMEGFESDDHFFVADATDLCDVEDSSYDVVIASDVFEHIPEELRENFLKELYRVAKYAAIICFPFDAEHVSKAEKRANEYFKALTGTDYEWLIEHIQNGLPNRKKVDNILDDAGIFFSVIEHGSIEMWEKVMKVHFYACQYAELIAYREMIDEYYDEFLYSSDVSEKNYRVFYALCKNREIKEHCDGIFEKLFSDTKISGKDIEKIDEMCQEVHQVASLKTLHYAVQSLELQRYQTEQLNTRLQETEQLKESYHMEIQNLRNVLEDYKKEHRQLQQDLTSVEIAYDQIRHSTFWKITKPFRVATDGLKKIKLIRYAGKIVSGVRRDGVKKTGRRVLDKVSRTYKNQHYKKNIITVEEVQESILFSILVPLYNTELIYLKELLDSVLSQTYSNWELWLGDASTENLDAIREVCQEYQNRDERIHYFRIEHNEGISENTNMCAKKAQGEYIVLCDHDDIMDKEALRANAWMIQHTEADVLYSDEDHIDKTGNHFVPLFKPDWSPDLLRSQMYTCHLFVFRRTLFEELGGFNKVYDGSQDYDLMLRFSEKTDKIAHIPMVLYSWREIETSTAANVEAKPYAQEAGRSALDAHLKRLYGENAYAENREYPFLYEANYGLTKQEKPLVSIIIPMKDQYALSRQCINSILEKTSYQNFEILLLNNRSEQEESYQWFESVQKESSKIRVLDADFEFNWSKLNNFGMEHARGDVFVFLNNDTLVISPDWLDKLCDNALREDIGVVGPMLAYEDDTIQHAGIVVGMGGWADHVYKGMRQEHYASPYISSMVSRNVMAVTGACMVVSRKTIEQIGNFDEEFIICGSDVELCIRAYDRGLNNLYHAGVKLYHLESKSRDSHIPEIDFQKSYQCYTMCREYGDPYYNVHLNSNSTQPEEDVFVDWEKIKAHLRTNRFTAGIYEDMKKKIMPSAEQKAVVAEVQAINARKIELADDIVRINILLPSVDTKHVFGGIATALNFYQELVSVSDCMKRIIVTDAPVSEDSMIALPDYHIVDAMDDEVSDYQIVPMADRAGKTLAVSEKDIFIATGWWTAYTIADVIRWQKEMYSWKQKCNPLIYMIQDYEPGFYPWSSRYLMADSTYQLEIPTIAVINSQELKDFLEEKSYHFYRSFCFDPVLNLELKKYLLEYAEQKPDRKKQILVYGRPSVDRNAFALVVDALKAWVQMQNDAREWNILSAGESFEDIALGKGKMLHSIGKVGLAEYAKVMAETKIAVSLMVSPHPSYPPLEMSSFGVKVITNHYANKDLSDFNENIISLSNCSAVNIAEQITELCRTEDGEYQTDLAYVKNADSGQLKKIAEEIRKDILYGSR